MVSIVLDQDQKLARRRESRRRVIARFTVTNLTNRVALYNFLSTFSVTHFVPPRTSQASIGYVFEHNRQRFNRAERVRSLPRR